MSLLGAPSVVDGASESASSAAQAEGGSWATVRSGDMAWKAGVDSNAIVAGVVAVCVVAIIGRWARWW